MQLAATNTQTLLLFLSDPTPAPRCLTLVNMQEGFSELAGQQRLGQVSEELFDHVGHVVS